MRRILTAGLVSAVGLAGAVVWTAAPAQAAERPRVDFAFNARSVGAAVRTNGVDLRAVRAGFANTSCTRTLGRETRARAADLPVGDFVDLTLVESRNKVYRNGDRYGIRATTTVGRVDVGVPNGPGLSLRGIRSTANAFSDGGTLKTQEDFTFEGLSVNGVPNNGGPLGQLLDAIGGGVGQIIQVLQQADQPIVIPGLAELSLGDANPRITRGKSAISQTTGLRIKLLVGDLADVTVGSAYARIGKQATAGVLGISTQALEGGLVNDFLGVGATNRRTIDCEGTRNKVETFRRASSGIVAPVVVDVQGSVAQHRGVQKGSKGNGMGRHRIQSVQVVPDQLSPLLPTITLRNIDAKVAINGDFGRKGSKRVKRTVTSSVGALLVRGRQVPLPRPGNTRRYDGGTVQVTRQIVRQGFYGADVTAVQVKYLPELVGPGLEPVTLNLGVVDADFLRG